MRRSRTTAVRRRDELRATVANRPLATNPSRGVPIVGVVRNERLTPPKRFEVHGGVATP